MDRGEAINVSKKIILELRDRLSIYQAAVILTVIRKGEEWEFFANKLKEIKNIFDNLPKLYSQEDVKDPVVHLHYFKGDMDAYITEGEGNEGFGWVELLPGCGELGYVFLPDYPMNGFELDMYWIPKPLSEALKERPATKSRERSK